MSTSCLIYSKAPDIPYDIWTHAKILSRDTDAVSVFTLSQLIDSRSGDSKPILNTGHGIFIEMNSTIYVMTCNHIVKNHEDLYGYVDTDKGVIKFKLTMIGSIDEFDFVILCPNQDLSIVVNPIKFNTVSENLSSCKLSYTKKNQDKLKIQTLHQTPVKTLEKQIIDTVLLDIQDSHLKSVLVPKIPLIKFTCIIPETSDEFNPDGLSGASITIDDNIVGMIFCYSNKYIEAVPIYFLKLFAQKIIMKKTNIHLKGCVIPIVTADMTLNDGSHVVKVVTDDTGILYKTLTKTEYKFKAGTIIMAINDKVFTNTGKIYIDELDAFLQIDTYIMICTLQQTQVKFTVVKENVNMAKINFKNIMITPLPFEKQYVVAINNNNKYVHWKGLTFCELSEELIIKLGQFGIKLVGKLFSDYKIPSIHNKKSIVLIDVNYSKLDSVTSDMLTRLGAPYVKLSSDGYALLVLDRVNKKKIINLIDLAEALKITRKNTKIIFESITESSICKLEM
jgi:hypothetical protein